MRHEGILYKRRDIFQKTWRPRWFILQPDTQVLTYHLLSSSSETSFDLRPRGTIYLRDCAVEINHHLSKPDENLFVFTITPPFEQSDSSPCFLATTTEESREEWIQALNSVQEQAETSVDLDESVMTDVSVHGGADEDYNVADTLKDVPDELAQRIQTNLVKYLPILERSHGWKPLVKRKGLEAWYNGGTCMLKAQAVLPFPPKQVFNLLIDVSRRSDFENVQNGERLQRFNPHTTCDYMAYRAVWPTQARDFAVVTHWRVLERPDDSSNTIILMAFSDPAVNKPLVSNHVRAHLKISLYTLEPQEQNTKLTRILSYDLCGNVPRSLTKTVLQQQATLPLTLQQHLQESEPNPPHRLLRSNITNASIARDVIDHLDKDNVASVLQRGESLALPESLKKSSQEKELSLQLTAILLLTPLVLWWFCKFLHLPGREVYFVVAAVLAVRAVVLSQLGQKVPSPAPPRVNTVTCRFSVDLKGVLRFLANRKEEQKSEHEVEVSVIDIVIEAIAIAVTEEEPKLKSRHMSIPILGIDGHFLPQSGGVDISLLVPNDDDAASPDVVYTLENVESMNVQDIADAIHDKKAGDKSPEKPTGDGMVHTLLSVLERLLVWMGLVQQERLGSCLLICSPDSEHNQVDIDASPLPYSGVNVVVVVGGVRLVRKKQNSKASMKPPPTPTLSMSITIDCPICSLAASRKFAERVQQLVQYPEMCED